MYARSRHRRGLLLRRNRSVQQCLEKNNGTHSAIWNRWHSFSDRLSVCFSLLTYLKRNSMMHLKSSSSNCRSRSNPPPTRLEKISGRMLNRASPCWRLASSLKNDVANVAICGCLSMMQRAISLIWPLGYREETWMWDRGFDQRTLTISLRIRLEMVFSAAKRTLSERSRKQP